MKLPNSGKYAILALVLASLLAAPVAGAATANDELAWGEDPPNTYVYEDHVTIAQHNLSEMGSVLEYYDDSGDVATLPAELNESIDNPVRFRADKLDAETLSEFPRKSDEVEDASAVDAGEWSSSSLTVSDVTTAGDVDAVKLASNGSMSTNDVATATYSNFTIDSDPAKRVALLVGQVNTLDSSATVYINATESDGDMKSIRVDPDANADNADVAANATANGFIEQEKLSDLSTQGDGDGSFDAIDKIVVKVVDADATLTLSGVDLDRKSTISFGSHLSDTDGDDELETVSTEQNADGGLIKLSARSTLPSEFDDATIFDLEVHGLRYDAEHLDSEDVYANFTDAPDYPDFNHRLEVHYRHKVPSAIDLSHNGLELRTDQAQVSDRYLAFRFAENAGDSEPADVNGWTDKSGSIAQKGDTITLDDTIQAGNNIMTNVEVLLTADQVDAYQSTGGGGGTGPQGSAGGPLDFLFSLPGMLLAGVTGWLGLRIRG